MLTKICLFLLLVSVATASSKKDYFFPTELWDKITEMSFEKSVGQGGTVMFVPIKVILQEKSSGVLTQSEVEIQLPPGGGEIDLSNFVKTDKNGTFFVRFEFEGFEKENLESLKVYFVGRAKQRKIGAEIIGSGCGKYFDVKSKFLSENANKGMAFNSTQNRHLTALGGSFMLAYKNSKQTAVSQVTFTDTQKKDYFCEELGKKK